MARELPWDGVKVGFGVLSVERLWKAADESRLVLPAGWELIETDCSGARCVAIFSVEGVIPTPQDAYAVKRQLRRFCR